MFRSYVLAWINAFHPKRRMARRTYFEAMLLHFVIGFIPSLVVMEVEALEECDWISVPLLMFGLMSIIPMVSSTVQRMHDVGKSGWYLLLCMVLNIVGIGVFLWIWQVGKESAGENRWGKPPLDYNRKEEMADSFVDERVTKEDLAKERREFWRALLYSFLIVVAVCLLPVVFGWV
ncbi:MAG: DUF805 domain-containing protein [Clostridium sp.]|nr:DUF805 domain-containing protein [Clostridium sp.]